MRHIVLFSTMVLVAGLFAAGLAMGAGQQEQGRSQLNSSSQNTGVLIAQTELGVGTASGETHEVQGEYKEITKGMAPQNLNKDQIRELQMLLNKQGYNAGAADGVIGSKTRQALRSFQESQGIAVTGIADEATLRALAPSAKQQEFFGLSPKFGEEGKHQQMQQEEMQQKQQMENQPQEQGVGPGSGQSNY
jgi:hypothetical protein